MQEDKRAHPELAVPQKLECPPKRAVLEIGAERKLQVAHVVGLAYHLTKGPGRIGMIEGVERLRAKLEPAPLADWKLLVQTNVPILQAGPVDQPTYALLEIELPWRRRSKDPLIHGDIAISVFAAVRTLLASRYVHYAGLEPLSIWAKCLN